MNTFLWVIIPYIAIATFVLGHVWRYRYDKFGWTTRSSQLYESRLLRLGSPLFHWGILLVLLGHVGGILIPHQAVDKLGLHEHGYHLMALTIGGISGAMTLAGIAILIYRRRTVGPVFSATTRNDKAMYALLGLVIAAGAAATGWNGATGGYNYRNTVAPYFRSIFYGNPHTDLIANAPLLFQIHAFAAWVIFAMWPFTRLVHLFSAPLGYVTRPYVVYRSRETTRTGARPVRRGWEPIGTPGKPDRGNR
jgi:nitrate reductase gamma subunit